MFSDIEGSTRLVIRLRDRYVDLLLEHQSLLRAASVEHGSREIGTQGDAFVVCLQPDRGSCGSGGRGSARCVGVELAQGAAVKVRIGIHIGEPSLGEEGYQVLGVRRTVRICVAGYGGQILLSNASRELIEDELSDDLALVIEERIGLRISSGQSGFPGDLSRE